MVQDRADGMQIWCWVQMMVVVVVVGGVWTIWLRVGWSEMKIKNRPIGQHKHRGGAGSVSSVQTLIPVTFATCWRHHRQKLLASVAHHAAHRQPHHPFPDFGFSVMLRAKTASDSQRGLRIYSTYDLGQRCNSIWSAENKPLCLEENGHFVCNTTSLRKWELRKFTLL